MQETPSTQKTTFSYNNFEKGKKVLNDIDFYLRQCESFIFSVAFITEGGLNKLKTILKDLEGKDIKGKILTTDYLYFTQPQALSSLIKLKNIEVRMFKESDFNLGFHTKGYIFEQKDHYNLLIGSSNITADALTTNKEWNQVVYTDKNSIQLKEVLDEFYEMRNKSTVVDEFFIKEYSKIIQQKFNEQVIKLPENKITRKVELKPNSMQQNFIANLNSLIQKGQKRALLISATGTGKTFASAFAIKYINNIKINKVLYITHRENILLASKKTFEIVFGNTIKTKLYTGNYKNILPEDNFIFASYGIMQKEEYFTKFEPDSFDFIIIDEVHRVGDNNYLKIINYFRPKFLLGMSATPERNDNFDIFDVFDHNIALNIRLKDALNADLLVPFNYYGISDLEVNGNPISNKSDFNLLTSKERIRHIFEQAEYYGFCGKKVKGLIFVSSIDEGITLEEKINNIGKYKVRFLCGSNSSQEREKCIQMLENDDISKDYLDYIVTVDIFNEGIDIPPVNQVILLRPTESSIIFIQQIGRGLRKYRDKEYVNILDFIGNYDSNFNIARAFNFGKDTKNEMIETLTRSLPGSSIISFDEISRNRIYQSISDAKIYAVGEIKNTYKNVKYMLGKIPTLQELNINSNLDCDLFTTKHQFSSYYEFLKKYEPEYTVSLSKQANELIEYFCLIVFDGKSKNENDVLLSLIHTNEVDLSKYNENEKEHLLSLLNLSFSTKKIDAPAFIVHRSKDIYEINPAYNKELTLVKKILNEYLEYSIYQNKQTYNSSSDFVRYETYTRKDVSRIINLKVDNSATMFGYKLFRHEHVLPIFVNYRKIPGTSTSYEDGFIDQETFIWYSRHNRTIESPEIKQILDEYEHHNLRMPLFISKNNSKYLKDNKYFKYYGDCKILSKENEKMATTNENIVKFTLSLDEVNFAEFNYLVSNLEK